VRKTFPWQLSTSVKAPSIFYQTTLVRGQNALKIPRNRRIEKLPVVLSKGEVGVVLNKVQNLKHRSIRTFWQKGANPAARESNRSLECGNLFVICFGIKNNFDLKKSCLLV